MNKLHTNFLLCIISIVATMQTTCLFGQVTIGTVGPPKQGALLDLRQDDRIGSNSNKGMMLPRVKLTKADDITIDISGVTAAEVKVHTGLLVYNTSDDFCGEYPLASGLHVWDGDFWQYMGPDIKHPEVKEFVDPRDGEKYLYRSFGDEAGVWMLENIRARRLPGATTDIALHTGAYNVTTPSFGYPSDTEDGWTNPTPGKGRVGLIYNWYAFTNNYQPGNIEQGELAGGVTNPNSVENVGPDGTVAGKKYVQGICPNGWHLPSDREWNLLEKEIYQNAEKYSAYPANSFTPSTWQDEWNWEYTEPRGSDESTKKGHSYAMINICSAGGVDNVFGKSYPAEYGGFNAHITGYFMVLSSGVDPYEPGMCIFASASNSKAINGPWVRMIFNPFSANIPGLLQDTKVDRHDANTAAMVGVRCKQNAPGQ